MLIIGIFIFALAFATGYLVRRRAQATRCPHCGKFFAMREVSRGQAPVSSWDTTMHKGLFTLDLKGNVTEADAHAVPATVYVYNCVDQCKFCGFRKEEQRTQARRK